MSGAGADKTPALDRPRMPSKHEFSRKCTSAQHDETKRVDIPEYLEKFLCKIPDAELSETKYLNLRIRLDMVRAQLIRQIAKKTSKNKDNKGWDAKGLNDLLLRIEASTGLIDLWLRIEDGREGYKISNMFARFQLLMCRIYVSHITCKSSDTSSATSSADEIFENIIVKLCIASAICEGRDLKFQVGQSNVYDDGEDEWARSEWRSMLNDRKKILGIDHRHSIYAQHKYAKLCAKLDSNLDEAIKQVESAICYQKDEGWKVGTLIPTYGNLCLKAKRKLGEAIEKVSYGIEYQKDPDKKAELERLLVALMNEVESQSGTSSKRKRGTTIRGRQVVARASEKGDDLSSLLRHKHKK